MALKGGLAGPLRFAAKLKAERASRSWPRQKTKETAEYEGRESPFRHNLNSIQHIQVFRFLSISCKSVAPQRHSQ
jgi:hypothetical protein